LALGELILETNGKTTGIRVLSEGKLEVSYQGNGKLLGVEANEMYTAIFTPQPTGGFTIEANGLVVSREGDALTVKVIGVQRPTGAGFKASNRGGTIQHSASPKLARLNSVATSWEAETDEAGNYHLKVWEWK
jgi:hypothetical protein